MTPVASCVGVGEAPVSPPLRANVWWIDDSDAKLGRSSCLTFSQLEQENDVQDMLSLPPIAPAVVAKPQDAGQAADSQTPWLQAEELLGAASEKYRLVDDVTIAELQVLLERPGCGKYAAPAPASAGGPPPRRSASKLLQASGGMPEDKEQVRPQPSLGSTAPLPRVARGRLPPRGTGMAASGRLPRKVPSLAEEDDDGAAARSRPARSGPSSPLKGRSKRREAPAGGIAITSRESDMRRRWMLEDPGYMSRRIGELKDANFRAKEETSAGPPDRGAWATPVLLASGPAGGAIPPQPARRRAQGSAPPPPAAAAPAAAATPVAAAAGPAAAKKGGDHVAEVRELTRSIASSSRLLRVTQQAEEEEVARNSIAKTFGSMFRRSNAYGRPSVAVGMFGKPSVAVGDAGRSAPFLAPLGQAAVTFN